MKTAKKAPRIYLDYNATSPCRKEVLSSISRTAATLFGNASSPTAEGRAARRALEDARDAIADALGASSASEIVFTSGGTESDNLAILGAIPRCHRGEHPHLVTTAIEHYAVLNTFGLLENAGAKATRVGCDSAGFVAPENVIAALIKETRLVSVMHSNNEIGSIQDVGPILAAARKKNILSHCDAVQSLGRLPLNLKQLGADLVSFSGHKIGGPKGVGILYVRKGVSLAPAFGGGEQERKRRPGTENVPAIVGLALAIKTGITDQPEESRRLAGLRDMLWEGIRQRIPDAMVNGNLARGLPNTLNVSFWGINGEDVMMALDMAGVAVSTGSACAVGAQKASHVIEAMHPGTSRCCAPVRMSLGFRTTKSDIETALDRMAVVIRRLRGSGKPCCCSAK